jgi:hypothetical protein
MTVARVKDERRVPRNSRNSGSRGMMDFLLIYTFRQVPSIILCVDDLCAADNLEELP